MASVYRILSMYQIPHLSCTDVISFPPHSNPARCGCFWPHFQHEETEAARLSDVPKVMRLVREGGEQLEFSRQLAGPRSQTLPPFVIHGTPQCVLVTPEKLSFCDPGGLCVPLSYLV